LAERLRALEEPEVGAVARAERAYQSHLGGDCSVPLAGFAERVGEGALRFRGLVASLDGKEIAEAERSGVMSEAGALGASVAEAVLAAGGREILEALAAGSGETLDG
jgi:hydroxymethylbilane synthase